MEAENCPQILYRLRPPKAIYEFNELEKQEIHFSRFNELNDPMEGFLNLYWKGDKVVWVNFFKNFITSLFVLNYWFRFLYKNGSLENKPIWIPQDAEDVIFWRSKKELNYLFDEFFKDATIIKLIDFLSSSKTNKYSDEIIFILTIIIGELQHNIQRVFVGHKYDKCRDDYINEYITYNGIDFKEKRTKLLITIIRDLYISDCFNSEIEPIKSFKKYILTDFSSDFLKELEKNLYMEHYTASFTENIEDLSLWGYYADGHKGFALKFKTPISFKENGAIHKKIQYTDTFPEIDFFQNIAGGVNVSTLDNAWWVDIKEKKESYLYEKMSSNLDEWRKKYWGLINQNLSLKNMAWEKEKEYRYIINDKFINYSNNRNLVYDLSCLCGIVFGARMETSDKLEIIRILESKIEMNQEFNFYQAVYEDGKIKTIKAF